MAIKKETSAFLRELHCEYENYRAQGLSKYQAVKKLDYVHPITLSRLKKIIEDSEKGAASFN